MNFDRFSWTNHGRRRPKQIPSQNRAKSLRETAKNPWNVHEILIKIHKTDFLQKSRLIETIIYWLFHNKTLQIWIGLSLLFLLSFTIFFVESFTLCFYNGARISCQKFTKFCLLFIQWTVKTLKNCCCFAKRQQLTSRQLLLQHTN